MNINQLILGDNLEVMRAMPDESIDLIYLDPPFFSNRNYEVIWKDKNGIGDEGEVRSFKDRWAGGMEHYILWLYERVCEMHRLLKPTGSIFLHCDWHANAYIRVEILDRVFGMNNFRNEIIWKRKTGRGETNHKSNVFGVTCDTIFFYTKSNQYAFNSQFTFDAEGYYDYLETNFNLIDETGRKYRSADLGSPSPRPNLTYKYKGYNPPKNGWAIEEDKMKQWDKEGRLLFPSNKNGRIRRKVFLDEVKGKSVQNIWDDIGMVAGTSNERIGYPTQKPEALLQRIIECASNEGDVVLDPFVGGGTAVCVAEKLKRRWIGIDQSVMAVKVTDLRLQKQRNMYSQPYEKILRTYDYDLLFNKMEAHDFETFIITKFGGIPQRKKGADKGIDGKLPNGTPIQVKQQNSVPRTELEKFVMAAKRFDARLFEQNVKDGQPVGCFIAFSYSKDFTEEAARLRMKEHIIVEMKKVSEIVDYDNPPKVTLSAEEQEQNQYLLQAKAQDVDFYSWDFNHHKEKLFNPDVIFDTVGKQVRTFSPGKHIVAVKAVDEHGLEGMDALELKVKNKK